MPQCRGVIPRRWPIGSLNFARSRPNLSRLLAIFFSICHVRPAAAERSFAYAHVSRFNLRDLLLGVRILRLERVDKS
jgi:hypothetical protein